MHCDGRRPIPCAQRTTARSSPTYRRRPCRDPAAVIRCRAGTPASYQRAVARGDPAAPARVADLVQCVEARAQRADLRRLIRPRLRLVGRKRRDEMKYVGARRRVLGELRRKRAASRSARNDDARGAATCSGGAQRGVCASFDLAAPQRPGLSGSGPTAWALTRLQCRRRDRQGGHHGHEHLHDDPQSTAGGHGSGGSRSCARRRSSWRTARAA